MHPASRRVEPKDRLQFIVRQVAGRWQVQCDEEIVADAASCSDAEREATRLARQAHNEGRLTQVLIRQ
jgi:hypothetical protein